jgi:hypothetical protein
MSEHWPDEFLPPDGFVRFDEREDVLASLDLLKLIAPILEECPGHWKWMIVGAQSAVQGAMVCALIDTTGTSVLTKRSAAETLDWLEDRSDARGDQPDQRLADFASLFGRCLENGLKLSESQIRDIRRLHRYFRNNFAHFMPQGWSIEKEGLPRIIGAALEAVEQLMNLHQVAVHLDDQQQQRLHAALRSTRGSLGV